MIKAIFLDYTGTMVNDEEYTKKMLGYFMKYSDMKDPMEVFNKVWGMIKKIEAEHVHDTFVKKDEMVDMILSYCVEHFGLKCDLDEIHTIWRDSWIHSPLFSDVKPFFERSTLPIYVVTNDDLIYIQESMREKDLQPAGIISAEMINACKPHREILDKALEVAGILPSEAVLIGDSETSDVNSALEVGIKPVLLDRAGKSKRSDIDVINSLDEYTF